MIIVFEGIDGSGKTTQTDLLIQRLKKEQKPVETLDFPQYSKNFFGALVKKFLKGEFGTLENVDPHVASLLYALDRWESKKILDRWLKQKKIIVLNRYTTSNILHQTAKLPPAKHNSFISFVEKMEYEIFGLPRPDAVLYLSVPVRYAVALIEKRGYPKDIAEKNITHLKKSKKVGEKISKTHVNWHSVPCIKKGVLLKKETIAKYIWDIIKPKLRKC